METSNETNNVNEHNKVKNNNEQGGDQLGVYMRGQGIESSTTEDNSCLWRHDHSAQQPPLFLNSCPQVM